jgi:hypothetical protein
MNQKEVLKAFFEAKAKTEGMELESWMVSAIHQNTELKPVPSNEAEEVRTVTITESSDGNVTAESIKLYNLSEISLYDIMSFVRKEVGILIWDDTAAKIAWSLFALLWEFYPHLKKEFQPFDSQVLFAVSQLPEKAFTFQKLEAKLNSQLKENVDATFLNRSLNYLIQLRVIERTKKDAYKKKEKLKNVSRY